jgi:two-component system sensor histidine kinase ResE
VSARRAFGLQGWLVGALLAVGVVASLAVLLVVLPTLESSLRNDRAKREGTALQEQLARVSQVGPGTDALVLARGLHQSLGAEVRVVYLPLSEFGPGPPILAQVPSDATLLSKITGSPSQPLPIDGGRAVAAAAPLMQGATSVGSVTAVLPLRGVSPELSIVRRRVVVAMIVVLGLAALAGVALARVIGGRIRRLAGTAATLAAGDLSARAPDPGIAPAEVVTLGESLNGMAGRLESLVSEITDERDRDRAMIGSLAEGVLTVAPDGSVMAANEAAIRMLGLSGEGSARLDALPAPIIDAVLSARGPAGPPPGGRPVTLPNGLELDLHIAPLAQGRDAGTVITLRDVTEERRLERARRDLVANVSHELKTPIAALKGFLELLEDGVDARHQAEFLAAMSQETERLERLVEEQLQLARLDSGGLPLEREPVDLGELAEHVVAPRIPLAAREGVELSAVREDGVEAVALADPARVEQIMLILLDNALRHTPAGGRVEARVGRDGDDVTLAVRDTGEGIAEEDQPFVFDRFYRGDPSREGRSAGLGLAIARGLAEAHGGGIGLRSRPGAGSTFTVRLPAAPADLSEEAVTQPPARAGG